MSRVDQQDALELHKRLLSDDPTASKAMVDLMFEPILHTLGRSYPKDVGSGILLDATMQALRSYLDQPRRYNPEGKSLLGWLIDAAMRDRIDLMRKEHRRPDLVFSGNMFDIDDMQVAAAIRARDRRYGRRTAKRVDHDYAEGGRRNLGRILRRAANNRSRRGH